MPKRILVTFLFMISSFLSYSSLSLAAPLKPVEASKVCMVNNMLFPNDQIPVVVGGKTYYGCCAMCKKTLAEDSRARTAVDPVSGESVDKADAVIGADDKGQVQYFKSQHSLEKYNAGK